MVVFHTMYLKVAILLLAVSTSLSALAPKVAKNDKRAHQRLMPRKMQVREYTQNPISILQDLPTKNDLNMYITSLVKIVQFCSANRHEVDLNFAFGLFLVKVNLESALSRSASNLPEYLRKSIFGILEKSEELLQYFNLMLQNEVGVDSLQYKQINTLFNDKEWLDHINKYNAQPDAKFSQKTSEQLASVYGKWVDYKKNSFVASAKPNGNESDECIASIATSPVSVYDNVPICQLDDFCYDILLNGTDLGYALTHRLILLLLSRLARGCSLLTPNIDRELALRFCSAAYSEAQYITQHNLKEMDLIMEQIMICGTLEYNQLIRTSWIQAFYKKRRQTKFGCFLHVKYNENKGNASLSRKWMIVDKRNKPMKRGICDRHTTIVAAGGLAVAIRFIVNMYY